MPQGLLRMLHKRPRIAAELRRPQGERRRGRTGLLDLNALLEWLWGQTAVPERRARVWVQWLHTRLARLDLAAAHAEADAQVLCTSLPGCIWPRISWPWHAMPWTWLQGAMHCLQTCVLCPDLLLCGKGSLLQLVECASASVAMACIYLIVCETLCVTLLYRWLGSHSAKAHVSGCVSCKCVLCRSVTLAL